MNDFAKITNLSHFAKKQGLKIGDELVSIDGYKFCDVLDLQFYESQEKFFVEILRKGKQKKVQIKKRFDQLLDIEIDQELEPYRCKNKCKFCFVDQLPKGMRDLLYVKDDDYRFSFICGGFITMTNLSDEEIDRIIRLKLSPLYVSIHAFDDEVRKTLVRNPKTLNLIKNIKRLTDNGIKIHTQMVVVPGINDGKVLEEGIRELHKIENIMSVAVVPVGLTKHREKLDYLPSVDKQNAVDTIKMVEKLNDEFKDFCWCSDEYYIKAEMPFPPYEYYYDFEQIENGIGLVADFKENLKYSLEEVGKQNLDKKLSIITGVSFAPIMEQEKIAIEKTLGVEIDVQKVENDFFGHTVTVAGLLTAGDIINQVKNNGCDAFLIPNTMLKELSNLFLDNVTVETVEKALGAKIVVVSAYGTDMAQKIMEI